MAKTQAIILAAGRGTRLGKSSHEIPKCLLEIGRRRLIEHQLDALADAGVGPVVIVVGYGGDEVREVVGMRAEYVVNSRWSATNSLYSFWLAREAIQGDLVVLNCDVLFSPEILDRLLSRPGDLIAIDSGSGTGREQMKVRLAEGRLVRMSKTLPAEFSAGENVGILKLTEPTAGALFEKAGELLANGHEDAWIGAAMDEIADQHEIRTVDVTGIPWVEIDFPVDLARARKEVWPALEGGAYRRRRFWRAAGWALGTAGLVAALFLGGLMLSQSETPTAEWETVPIEAAQPLRISLGERFQSWWLLGEGTVQAFVTGPGPARIESRLIGRTGEREPYVLEVQLDGERVDWYKLTTRPSGKATHPDWPIGRKKRVSVEIPEGRHTISVSLVAPTDTACLVRFRQLDDTLDDN